MQRARIGIPGGILVSLFVVIGCASITRRSGGGLPSCVDVGSCAPSVYRDSLEFGPAQSTGASAVKNCNAPATLPSFVGPTVVSDFSDGVSSDGRGPYASGNVDYVAVFGLQVDSVGGVSPRKLVVNLSHPVRDGGGVPLGLITLSENKPPQSAALYAQWRTVDNTSQNLNGIPIGQTVTAPQMNVWFYLNGRFHMLQMGPQPWGHCYAGRNLVTGAGTSSATISRSSATKWAVDLPAGSVGRLFDLHNTSAHAVDRGLYYLRLHYEIATKPRVSNVLQPLAEAQGGAAVVAKYRALKRDSAEVYFFDESELYRPGSWLLNNKQPQDALHVFRLYVEEYPTSWGSHRGLGHSYLAAGDTSRAIASYRRSLELNPDNIRSVEILKGLGAKP